MPTRINEEVEKALKESHNVFSIAQKRLKARALEDLDLLMALVKPHLDGIIGHALQQRNKVWSKEDKGVRQAANAATTTGMSRAARPTTELSSENLEKIVSKFQRGFAESSPEHLPEAAQNHNANNIIHSLPDSRAQKMLGLLGAKPQQALDTTPINASARASDGHVNALKAIAKAQAVKRFDSFKKNEDR